MRFDRNKRSACAATLVGVVWACMVPNLFAQSATSQPAVDTSEEAVATEFAYGDVTNVSSTALSVNQYDYMTGEIAEMTYEIDPNVELTNVESIDDIAVGDAVDVEYVIKDNKNVAVALMVEKLPSSDDLSGSEEETFEDMPSPESGVEPAQP